MSTPARLDSYSGKVEPSRLVEKFYKNFLSRCRQHNIFVSAHRDVSGGGRAHPPHPQIAVFRPGIQRWMIGPISDENDIEEFVLNSPDASGELCILLHEYGHYKSNHPDIDFSSDEGKQKGLREEEEAWSVGKELFVLLGATSGDLAKYDCEAKLALHSYRKNMLGE